MEVTTKMKNGDPIVTFKAHALIVIAGVETHKLALHRDKFKMWNVTDPESGALVVRVHNNYKGMPVSSRTLTLKIARELAAAEVDHLIARVGIDLFNATLARARAKFGAAK
jgi:hypothetical protein